MVERETSSTLLATAALMPKPDPCGRQWFHGWSWSPWQATGACQRLCAL